MSKIPCHSFCYFPKPSSFSSSPPPLSGDDLVLAAVSILKHQRSKSRWSNLRSLLTATKDKRLTASQFSEIAVQLRNNAHLAMRFFHFTVDHSLSSHSLYSYATVIHILARSRLKLHALNLIKSAMCRFPEAPQQVTATPVAILEALVITYRACASAPFVFDLLVRACLESKKIDIAVEIYAILKSKNVYLRTRTCNSLIESVAKSRGCFAGYNLYREIFYLDVDNVVRNRNSGKGVCPTANTLNVVMIGFYREGLVDKVEEVWQQEFASVGCVPNIYSFNVLMAAYCDEGRMKDAMRVWEEMENRGLNRDAVAYKHLFGGFVGLERLGGPRRFIGKWKNFSLGSSTVNVIIKSLCDKNKISAASEFYRMAVKKHDVVLEKENYENLTRGLCQEGKTEEALKLQVEMVGKGFRPNSAGM
ncbi:UNVERIFIED_CONTAM: Pentatricopeptide repeat-containing protein [Sesamum radiatum]|uniref:Pentatricopeptide repeat-containing protein n=1 Tax=Sesamum radiatum TaxID=300843 RepID=A0AAW2U9N8_SESRA